MTAGKLLAVTPRQKPWVCRNHHRPILISSIRYSYASSNVVEAYAAGSSFECHLVPGIFLPHCVVNFTVFCTQWYLLLRGIFVWWNLEPYSFGLLFGMRGHNVRIWPLWIIIHECSYLFVSIQLMEKLDRSGQSAPKG